MLVKGTLKATLLPYVSELSLRSGQLWSLLIYSINSCLQAAMKVVAKPEHTLLSTYEEPPIAFVVAKSVLLRSHNQLLPLEKMLMI